MNYTIYRIVIVLLALLICTAAYFLNKKARNISRLKKTLALVLAIMTFSVSLLHNEAISIVIGLNRGPSPFGDILHQTAFATILVWLTYAAILITSFSQFYEYATLKYATRFFAIPVYFLDIVFFKTYAIANVGLQESAGYAQSAIFMPFIAASICLGLAISLTNLVCDKLPRKKALEILAIAGTTVACILPVMPSFVPQVLLGFFRFTEIKFNDFSEPHRFVLYFSVIIPLIIFHLLKNKSSDTKRFGMIFLSIAVCFTYLSYFELSDWITLYKFPLDICSMVIILLPIALLTNRRGIFHFCLFLGVLSAFTNILFPANGAVDVTSTESVRFWTQQYFAFSVPILCTALKVFKRPDFPAMFRSILVFTIYFILTLVLDTWMVNYELYNDYLNFDGNYLLSIFGDFSATFKTIDLTVRLGNINLVFYPFYQYVVFLSYLLLIVIMWFAYKLLFATWDKAEDRRLRERDYKMMKKELKEFLGARSTDVPLYGDDSPKLVLREFSKKYGTNKHYSVDHVSFKVKGGEIFGFLGPNGAGKSTIIKSIVGIQTITSGSIEISGYDVERQSIHAKLNTGFVPDHYALYENLTGREYINYIADLYDVDKEKRNETIEKYVQRFQLSHSFDNQMKTYSHGMKQKIAIMAALVHDPKVWILDEPLTGLDPNSIFEVKECMKEHAAKGNIVFFSSHIIDVVEKICDKIAIIKKGKLRAVASVSELDAQNIDLEELYLHVITADEKDEIINIGGDDILNVNIDSTPTKAEAKPV